MSSRHVSELALFYQLLDELPPQLWVILSQRQRGDEVEEVLDQRDAIITLSHELCMLTRCGSIG